jgi:cation:H+ antiporter
MTVAVLFVLAGRAANGLGTLVSDKISQWTLLVGMLPLAMSVGAGSLANLPLDARQAEELLLTAAQSLFALGLLLRLRLGLVSAFALASLFGLQVGLAFAYRDDAARTVATLSALAWVYLGLAAILFLVNRRHLVDLLRVAFLPPAAGAPGRPERPD